MDNKYHCKDKWSIEEVLQLRHLEQYVQSVVTYSSRYNNRNSYSYSPNNLVGKYVKYPSYGDFPEAYFLRSYGKWWKQSTAAQKEYRPQDFDLLAAEDFINLEFGNLVIPRQIFIYEVYNPGAIVRIWGCIKHDPKWHLLWEGFPKKCAPKSRKFSPPLRKINSFVNVLRLEFNQNHLDYHTAIDAVLLSGFQPVTHFQLEIIMRGLIEVKPPKGVSSLTVSDLEKRECCDVTDQSNKIDYFSTLPDEIIMEIFHYLDLKSLSKCAQVNKRWNKLSQDQTLYQNISLKTYWHLMNRSALEYFTTRISNVKKLDISWCNDVNFFSTNEVYLFNGGLKGMVDKAKDTITHLSMQDNYLVDNGVMQKIALCKELVELRLHHTFNWSRSPLAELTKLVTLDLSMTHIVEVDLIRILEANPHLENLLLDLCENLTMMDNVVETATIYNKKLRTWSSWKTRSLTSEGIRKFSVLQYLEELDLGWCLLHRDPGLALTEIANGCKLLRRLIVSQWRSLNDQLLMPVILYCKELSHLDLIGIKNISSELCEKALFMLPKLRLLDISFCNSIRQSEKFPTKKSLAATSLLEGCTLKGCKIELNLENTALVKMCKGGNMEAAISSYNHSKKL